MSVHKCLAGLAGLALMVASVGEAQADFVPTDMAGLRLWLDASDVDGSGGNPSNGALVSQWNDKSGLSNHASAPAGQQPRYVAAAVNGRGAIDFGQDNNDYFATSSTSDFNFTEASIFLVSQGTDPARLGISQPGTWNNEYLFYDTRVHHVTETGVFSYRGHQTPPTGYFVQLGVFGTESTDLDNYIDGVLSTESLVQSGSPSAYTSIDRAAYVGWRGNRQPFDNYSGLISEILVYGRKLTPTEQNQVGYYLEQRYGLDTAYAVPEPSTLIALTGLLGMGLIGHWWRRRKAA